MSNKKAFTLVEILIVVIILGILAAIVIPQFTEASNDARASALASDLQTARGQVELFKIQHVGALPGAESTTSFVEALTMRTDVDGKKIPSGGDPNVYQYGPYLQTFPTNAFNDKADVRVDGAAAGADTHGWHYAAPTGRFSADDDATHAAW